jgi:hypothetical protein
MAKAFLARLSLCIMSSVDPPVSFMMAPKYVYVLTFSMLFLGYDWFGFLIVEPLV